MAGYILDKDNIYVIPSGAAKENAGSVAKRHPRFNPVTGCGII